MNRILPTLRGAAAASWLALLAVGSTGTTTSANLDLGPWPMFHRAPDHRAFSATPPPTEGTVAFRTLLSDTVEFSSPVISSTGTIYIGDQGKDLWALDPFGNPKWSFHTGGNIRYSTPAVRANGSILVGSADGRLYAVNSQGFLLWTFATGGAVKTSPAVAPDGTIYFGSDDGKLWALFPSGQLKWSFAAQDTIRSSPAVGPDGTVYFGSNDGVIRAVTPLGSLLWEAATGGAVRGSPAVYNGKVYVGSSDGFLYALRTDGSLEWAAYTENNLRSSPAVGITGKIYLGMDTKIACFHDSGDPCYEFETDGRVLSSPAVYAGIDSVDVVLCGSDSGSLYCIRDGDLLWMADLGSAVRSSPAIGPFGFAYVGAMDGALYGIGEIPPAGAETWVGQSAPALSFHPNPSTWDRTVRIRLSTGGTTQGRLEIVDPTGRRVYESPLSNGEAALLPATGGGDLSLTPGVYFARWSDGGRPIVGRIVRLP